MSQATESPQRAGHPATPAAKTPVGPGRVSLLGMLIALLLLAIAVVLAHDTLVATGTLAPPAWLNRAAGALDGLRAATWVLPASIVVALVGLWLLLVALRPRPRTMVRVQADTGVFLRPHGIERLARHAAGDVDGVTGVHASATRRKVDLRVEALGGDEVAGKVRDAVSESLRALEPQPKVSVKTKLAGGAG